MVLLLVVTSRVLSPQYMIWLLGLAAVVLAAKAGVLRRAAWMVVVAAIVTASGYSPLGPYNSTYNPYGSPFVMLVRNAALLIAAIDVSVTMVRLLKERRPKSP